MASLAVETATQTELASVVSGLLHDEVQEVTLHARGRNSRVYQARRADGRRYAVKVAACEPRDGRNRVAAEFSAVRFLWTQGLRCVPEPIAVEPERGCAIYAYIDGRQVNPRHVTIAQVDELVEFLLHLRALRSRPASALLPVASEACFSLGAVMVNLEQRLERLRGADERGALRTFLTKTFIPARDRMLRRVVADAQAHGLGLETELPPAQRTFSPSDVGFHNALLASEGRLVFVDFEHFGWDDPAKMLVDLLWHPQMATLAEPPRQRMLQRLFEGFADDPTLRQRVRAVYPLFGLKWCLILLNEFVPADQRRRAFAQVEGVDWTRLQQDQLTKAQVLLDWIMTTNGRFPYDD